MNASESMITGAAVATPDVAAAGGGGGALQQSVARHGPVVQVFMVSSSAAVREASSLTALSSLATHVTARSIVVPA